MLFCNTGALHANISSYGITPHDAANKGYCISGFGETAECIGRISPDFELQYAKECANKQFCILKDLDKYFTGPEDR